MIGYLKGNVLSCAEGTVLLEVNGVGYELACSGAAFAKLATDGKGEVYTWLQVRDDGVSLFGFVSPEEKNMFLKLISVSGVGPRMGIAVLSGMNLSELAVAIASSDVKGLCAVQRPWQKDGGAHRFGTARKGGKRAPCRPQRAERRPRPQQRQGKRRTRSSGSCPSAIRVRKARARCAPPRSARKGVEEIILSALKNM